MTQATEMHMSRKVNTASQQSCLEIAIAKSHQLTQLHNQVDADLDSWQRRSDHKSTTGVLVNRLHTLCLQS